MPNEVCNKIAEIITAGKIAEVVQSGNGDVVVRECTKEIKIKFPKNG